MALRFARTIKRELELELEKLRHGGCYTGLHHNLDLETHVREAAAWLKRAQDHGGDRGVSYGTRFGGTFLESYPETTGYIIPTFLRLADAYGDPEFEKRAIEMGDWEIGIQMDCGAVMGGRADSRGDARPATPAVFNTGMVLLGYAALVRRTGDRRFCEAGRRAAEWLLEIQEPDGSWVRGNSRFARAGATVYNVKAAWGLGEFGMACGEDRYVAAAIRNAEFALSRQIPSGWFSDCCLNDPRRPLLHTIAYTMQGLLEIGLLAERPDLIRAAGKSARALVDATGEDGFLPGRLNPDFTGAVPWSCLTGSAQTSIVWMTLHRYTGDDRYREAATRVNRYLMARHDVTSKNPAIRGGLAGSWPVWGEYGRMAVLNWATKFFVDALLLERSTVPSEPAAHSGKPGSAPRLQKPGPAPCLKERGCAQCRQMAGSAPRSQDPEP